MQVVVKWRRVTVTICLLLLLMLFGFEAYLRLNKKEIFQFEPIQVTRPDMRYNHTLRENLTYWSTAKGAEMMLRVNNLGLNEADAIEISNSDSVYRILLVGDRSVEGFEAPHQISFWLEQALAVLIGENGYEHIELINAGQRGYSALLHHARFIHQLYRLKPDAVIYFPDLTDVYDDAVRYRFIS